MGPYLQLREQSAPLAAPTRLRRISATVVLLGLTSLFTDLPSEMVAAVLPLYLTFQLGFSALQFGFIDGLYQGATAFVRVAGGFHADTRGRQKSVATFGVHRALDTVGALLAPLMAFVVLSKTPDQYNVVFVVAFCFSIVGVAIIVLFVREPKVVATEPTRHRMWREARELLREPRFRRLTIAATVLSLLTISEPFVYVVIQHAAGVSVRWFPLLFEGTAVSYLALAIPAGRLAGNRHSGDHADHGTGSVRVVGNVRRRVAGVGLAGRGGGLHGGAGRAHPDHEPQRRRPGAAMRAMWLRVGLFVVICAACAGVAVGYVVASLRGDNTRTVVVDQAGVARPLSVDEVTARPHLLFRDTGAGDDYGNPALSIPGDPNGPRALTDLRSDRVAMTAGVGICLRADLGIIPTYEAMIFDSTFTVRHQFDIAGQPSRTQLSRDGNYAAYTVFVTGHSYADGAFSTRTAIVDTAYGYGAR